LNNELKNIKHCKFTYQVVKPFCDNSLTEVIIVNGQTYQLDFLPRPAKNYADLSCVYYKGVRYSTRAKFLKSINK
jgi:hypothetical protein